MITTLKRYIDWNPFFAVYQLRGTYPTRNYPRLFNDPKVGKAASDLFDEGQKMFDMMAAENWIQGKAVIGLFPAHAEGDDIVVTDEKGTLTTFRTLRQQQKKEKEKTYMALADFIAPKDDHFGAFACSTGFGVTEKCKEFKDAGDDYSAIMLQ